MPLNWFRRKKKTDEEAAAPAAVAPAPAPPPESTTAPPAPDGTKPRRKRGTRGGRNRRKPGEAKQTPEERKPKAPERSQGRKAPAKRESKRDTGLAQRAPRQRRRPEPKRQLPPAKRELLVSVAVSEKRVAVLEDDKVAEIYLERPERRSIAGNVYLGTVDNVLPGMEAAFVEIGLEKNGFLYVDEIVLPELEGRRHGRKIQDLISRGQSLLVQAVKDPMKTKGARLTTEISLPGRFVVYVPSGEGLGVSRRLEDDERIRLRDIIKEIAPKQGGVIVRTAAEGASAEDIARDLDFLERLWQTIQKRAKSAKAPSLVYQEAELPLRVVRDLFTEDFVRAVVDDDLTYKRIVGYLKKTSPHMVERVSRYRQKTPLLETFGAEEALRSTLSRRVDLPSGGYLIFDYAEAFTLVDVNTGRFVGSRSKTGGSRLEDTITKNNMEAVKEVVRQLRMRDIGGIIVIDFIDMANPTNRALVEEALRTELERDRTKTYVVEISPLGLVEMTRQNVTEGPREILTKKCPTCAGDGIVVSEASAAVDTEQRIRSLVRGSRAKAFKLELHPRVAALLIGPGARRLVELEAAVNRRLVLEGREDAPLDHLVVLAQGTVDSVVATGKLQEGSEREVKLVEVGLHDPSEGIAKVDGVHIHVAGAAKLVGKKIKVRIERSLESVAFAELVADGPADAPITAEAEAERPTRRRGPKAEPAKPEATEPAKADDVTPAEEPEVEQSVEEVERDAPAEAVSEEKPRKKTRRGSRGGRGRKKKAPAATVDAANGGAPQPEPEREATSTSPRIHVPLPEIGSEDAGDEAGDAEVAVSATAETNGEAPKPRKKTRRGTRGGARARRRRERAAAAAAGDGANTEPPQASNP